jgi:hypothetical protein
VKPKPLSKAAFAALEKCWTAQLPVSAGGKAGMPAQAIGPKKVVDRLVAAGLIERAEVYLGGRFPVTIIGWRLTNLGSLVYCENCRDVEIPDGEGQ